ncbi:MAG TPA: Spy/CpxP family protein refolding chaperone [Longimicrobiales bacterium]|nr:Spy/CpxP family protein refolding chaperone [Longimicrobiales bacterium]
MRRFLAVLVLLVVPATVLAQGKRAMRAGGQPPHNVAQVILEHKGELSLNADQVAKLETIAKRLEEQNKPVLDAMARQRANLRSGTATEDQRQEMRAAMDTLRNHRQAAVTEINTILTAEQQQQARQYMGQGRRGGAGERLERGRVQRPMGMARGPARGFMGRNPVTAILQRRSELSLTEQQATQLESIAASLDRQTQPILQELRRDSAGGARTPEQMAARRATAEKLRTEHRQALEQVSKVLTKEQMDKVTARLHAGRGVHWPGRR